LRPPMLHPLRATARQRQPPPTPPWPHAACDSPVPLVPLFHASHFPLCLFPLRFFPPNTPQTSPNLSRRRPSQTFNSGISNYKPRSLLPAKTPSSRGPHSQGSLAVREEVSERGDNAPRFPNPSVFPSVFCCYFCVSRLTGTGVLPACLVFLPPR
jgi:hypothetical protein